MSKIEESRRLRVYMAGVFTASVLVTLLFWAVLPARFQVNESTDYIHFYEPVARNILASRGLVGADNSPAAYYPPGYPLLLAGIFALSKLIGASEYRALEVFALLCTGIASVLIFHLARTIWTLRSAMVVSLIWSSYPLGLWLTKQPNSEIPFWPLYYGGVALFGHPLLRRMSSWYLFFLCGALVGASMLIRPIAAGVGLVLGLSLCLLRTEKTLRLRLFLVGMLLTGNVLTILPWEVWLYKTTGKITILNSTGGVKNIRDGLTFAIDNKDYRDEIAVPEEVKTVMQDILFLVRPGQMSTYDVASVLVNEFRMHPLAVMQLLAMKAARAWYGTDTGKHEGLIMAFQIPYLIAVIWGGWNAWKRNEHGKELVVLIVLLTLYFWAMTVMTLSILRYMVPAMGLLFVFIPGVFYHLRLHWKN